MDFQKERLNFRIFYSLCLKTWIVIRCQGQLAKDTFYLYFQDFQVLSSEFHVRFWEHLFRIP